MDNRLKKLAKEIAGSSPQKQRGKSNRTLSLREPEFSILQKYCRSKGYKVSEVIDRLIEMFLEEIKDDLPPDLRPDIPDSEAS